MSILKNFVNPWESGGSLGSKALSTSVLDNNILESNNKIDGIVQDIIPTAYLFADDSNDISTKDLESLKKEISLIYKKNKFLLNIKIVSKEYIKQKDNNGFRGYELGIGIVDKPNAGSTTGFSRFKNHYEGEVGTKRKQHLTNELIVYQGEYLHTRVSYQLSKQENSNSKFYYYPVAYHAAHELLHQMIIKSFCQMYYSRKDSTEFLEKNIFVKMGVNDEQFELHANNRENLNMEGSKITGLPRYHPKGSMPSSLELILLKHSELLNFWVNPTLKGPLMPYHNFLVKGWEYKA